MSTKVPQGWSRIRLRQIIGNLDAGVSVNSGDCPSENGEPGVLKTSCVTTGTFRPSENKVVVQDETTFVKESPCEGGIIISRMNTPALVGASGYVDRDWPHLFLPDRLWQARISDKKKYRPRWLGYLLASDQIRLVLGQRATGTSGSMKNLSKEALLSIEVDSPPPEEQELIAGTLYGWDRAIDFTERLLVEKRLRRKGLMQQLLTGKRRLPGFEKLKEVRHTRYGCYPADWGYPRVGEIAKHVSIKNQGGASLPVLSCTKHRGLVDSMEYFGKQIFSKDLSTYKVVQRGQFAYATNHIEEGSIGYQDLHDTAVISPMYTVFEAGKKIDDLFLFLLLKTEKYRHIFEVNTSASVDRRGSLRWPDFSRIHVSLPSLDEQGAIVRVMSVVDHELDLLQAKVVALRKQKKGLMQQLLTGKKRVKV